MMEACLAVATVPPARPTPSLLQALLPPLPTCLQNDPGARSAERHRTCIRGPVLLVVPMTHSLGLPGRGLYTLEKPFELSPLPVPHCAGSAWLWMERGEQAVKEERSWAHSAAHSASSGREDGKKDALHPPPGGQAAELMEVLSPDVQVSGCFTQPHMAGAL